MIKDLLCSQVSSGYVAFMCGYVAFMYGDKTVIVGKAGIRALPD